jgi:hypothetical protein
VPGRTGGRSGQQANMIEEGDQALQVSKGRVELPVGHHSITIY